MSRKDASLINRVLCVTLAALLVCTGWWSSSAWGFEGRTHNIVGDEAVPMAAIPEEIAAGEGDDSRTQQDGMAGSKAAASADTAANEALEEAVSQASAQAAGAGASVPGEAEANTTTSTDANGAWGTDSASPDFAQPGASQPDSAQPAADSGSSLVGASAEEAAEAADERATDPAELGYVPGEIVVVYEDGVTPTEKADALETVEGAESDKTAEFAAGDVAKVEISDDLTVETAAEAIAEDPSVKYAVPNYIAKLLDEPAVNKGYEMAEAEGANASIASQTSGRLDDLQSSQWYLDYVKAPQAWNLLANSTAKPEKTKVAVIDTGASLTHGDLQNIVNKQTSIEVIYSGDPEKNSQRSSQPLRGDGYTNGGSSVDEFSSHGTHVSGIIAAEAGNGGLAGVASGGMTKIANDLVDLSVIDAFSLRVANSKGGYDPNATLYDIVYALAHARDIGAKVVNMSLGFPSSAENLTATMEQITTELVEKQDMVVVAAAGNDGKQERMLPAACSNVIGVISVSDEAHLPTGSTTFKSASWKTGSTTRSWFSNYGDWCDISAPGEYIISSYLISGATNGYAYMDGTSMASPVVAAAAAMVRSAAPSLSAKEVKEVLCSTADDLNTPGKDVQTGYGLVNAEAAVAKALASVSSAEGSGSGSGKEGVASETTDSEESKTYDPLDLQISYDKANLSCGTPTTFTLKASGGSGNYKYLQNFIWVKLDGIYTDDADWTRKKYTEDNTFQYTFVASGSYYMRVYVMDMKTFETKSLTVPITVSDSRYPSIEQVVTGIVNQCKSKGFKTEYEKALFLHDWVINNATYDNSLLYDGESGVLIRGTGTCESYHRAFALLLKRMGISCERATGNGHVWSCVKLDGKWTQIDPTWNGEEHSGDLAYLRHLYFGITDDMTKLVHSEHKPVSTRPCTTYDNNYFLRSGEISRWTTPVEKQIREKVSAGQTSFSVNAEYNPYPGVYRIIYPLAAYQLNKMDWKISGKRIAVSFKQTGLTSGYFYTTVTAVQSPDQGGSGSSTTNPGPITTPPQPKPNVPAQTIAPGTYTIRTAVDTNKCLDIWNGSTENRANVQIYQNNGTSAQQFKLSYDASTGYYTIINMGSGKALDVYDGRAADRTNVWQYNSNGSLAQRWVITGSAATGYTIASAINRNYVLDIYGGYAANSTNVQIYHSNNSKAQKFFFQKVSSASSKQPIPNGTYVIETGVASNRALDVYDGSTRNGANIQIYNKNGTAAQKFRLVYDAGSGTYTITNAYSGKALDVYDGRAANGTNVWQYNSNGTAAQRWYITGNASSGYTVASAINRNYVLDVYGGYNRNGTNVQIYRSNNSAAQKFFFRAA